MRFLFIFSCISALFLFNLLFHNHYFPHKDIFFKIKGPYDNCPLFMISSYAVSDRRALLIISVVPNEIRKVHVDCRSII